MNSIIKNYIPVAQMIAETFGSHCEVILHDFSKPQNSVVYTCNNTVTNRQVGESFTEYFIKEVLLSRKFHNDCSSNYMMKGSNGMIIKSSTALLRDNDDKVIGALCVNMDVTSMTNIMSQFAGMMGIEDMTPEAEKEVEVVPHIKEIVDDIIDKTIGDQNVDTMNRDQKIDLIRFMYAKGIFLIKGSTDKVADRMNISRVTVYSYLDEIKKRSRYRDTRFRSFLYLIFYLTYDISQPAAGSAAVSAFLILSSVWIRPFSSAVQILSPILKDA